MWKVNAALLARDDQTDGAGTILSSHTQELVTANERVAFSWAACDADVPAGEWTYRFMVWQNSNSIWQGITIDEDSDISLTVVKR